MKTFKKVLEIALDVLIVFIFLMSIVIIICNSNKDQNGNTVIFGKTFYTVASDSMSPTFKKGDIIICDVITDEAKENLKEGDVISFLDMKPINGVDTVVVNTHRIKEITANGTIRTKGDHEEFTDPTPRIKSEVVAIWHGTKIVALGGILEFLKTPAGFICCLIIPILAIIAFEAYKLIAWYVGAKQSKMREEIAKEEPTDEMKDAIIREYLAKQNQEKQDPQDEDK